MNKLVDALNLAANRIDRLSLELPFNSRERLEAEEWAQEARATLSSPSAVNAVETPDHPHRAEARRIEDVREVEEQASVAFDAYIDGVDLESSGWLDRDAGELFKDGFKSALSRLPDAELASVEERAELYTEVAKLTKALERIEKEWLGACMCNPALCNRLSENMVKIARAEIRAAPPSRGRDVMKMLNQPVIGSRWRHWKNGKIYTVVKFAVFCDTDHQERLVVIYEDQEGGSWARSEYEWHNTMPGGVRRFTEVEAIPSGRSALENASSGKGERDA